jgi:hypothetical protein
MIRQRRENSMREVKLLMALLLGMSLMLQGCVLLAVGAGAGAATVAYVKGELQTTYGAPLNRAWDASLAALKDLEIKVYSSKKDATEGVIEGTKADGTKVKVNLATAGPDTTTVKIRIGTFGDEEASVAINRKIGDRLGIK